MPWQCFRIVSVRVAVPIPTFCEGMQSLAQKNFTYFRRECGAAPGENLLSAVRRSLSQQENRPDSVAVLLVRRHTLGPAPFFFSCVSCARRSGYRRLLSGDVVAYATRGQEIGVVRLLTERWYAISIVCVFEEVCMTEACDRTEARCARLRAVLARRQPDLTLVLANIHDPHNVSAIYRSADAFGLMRVHLLYTDTAFPVLSRKTSASARKWVDTVRHKSIEELRDSLTGYQILATSCSDQAKPLGAWDLTKKTAFVMGNEHSGVLPELIPIATGEVYIPMYGMIQSFNVSVAAALLLYEAARQRDVAGMYGSPSLPPEEFERVYRMWLER